MPSASKVKMSGNEKKKRKKANRNTYVTRKFHVVVVSPINVIINHVILTGNVIKINHKCNKLLTINVIIWLTIKLNHKRNKYLTINE